MRPSPHVLAAASSLTGAFVGAVVALQLGVVELTASTATPATGVSASVAPAPVAGVREDGAGSADAGPRALSRREVSERRATVEAVELLHRWDGRRERAWARGDPAMLADLYTPRSAAGRRDVALLERYAARGWSVRGLVPRLLDARLTAGDERRVRLRVTEDYPAVRVDAAGALPGATRVPAVDDPGRQSRVVTLVRAGAGWRVARVAAG